RNSCNSQIARSKQFPAVPNLSRCSIICSTVRCGDVGSFRLYQAFVNVSIGKSSNLLQTDNRCCGAFNMDHLDYRARIYSAFDKMTFAISFRSSGGSSNEKYFSSKPSSSLIVGT